MANIQSQIKRNRQNERRRLRNKTVRSEVKTRLRQFRLAADAGNREEAEAAYQVAARKLDKAAEKGVVHANFAANHKAKMSRRLSGL
jgi:small subunit ribosomal protein S20